MKRALVLSLMLLTLISCQKRAVSTAPLPKINSDPQNQTASLSRPSDNVSLSEISLGSCMSLALLVDRLSDPMFDYPSALMTTDFKILDTGISSSNAKFIAYSAFYYKMGPASELVPFTKVNQTDCKTLQVRMASEQLLTFNIVESTDRHLKFQLAKEFGDEVPSYQRDALFKRYQTDEISVHVVSESEIKIVKKVKNFDPLCKKKKNGFNLQMTEVFSWKRNPADLPEGYSIDKSFLSLVLSALKTPPEVDAEKSLSVATIKDISHSLPADEIKICN